MLVFSIFHSYVSLPEGKHTEAPQLKGPTAPLHQEQSLEAKTQELLGLVFSNVVVYQEYDKPAIGDGWFIPRATHTHTYTYIYI